VEALLPLARKATGLSRGRLADAIVAFGATSG